MKVDRNQVYQHVSIENYPYQTGVPMRLEIAARFLNSGDVWELNCQEEAARRALKLADTLIKIHNETCEDFHDNR